VKERLLGAAGPLFGASLFVLALWILQREFAQFHLRDVLGHLAEIPPAHIALAVGLTAASYLALTGYDALAFRWLRNPLPYRRIALTSFIAYVFSHNIGVSFFGGSAVRYRMFSSWGVPPLDIARAIGFNVITFWLGFLATAGLALGLDPLPLPAGSWIPLASSRPIAAALLVGLGLYLVWSALRRAPVRIAGFEIAPPRPPLAFAQIAVSSLDWTLAACVLYALLPSAPGLSFPAFLGIYLFTSVAGLVSHVPAGLGVFETLMVLLLARFLPGDAVLGSIVAYRIIYYLVPLGAAAVLFGGFEALQRRRGLVRAQALLGQWVPAVLPRVFAMMTLLAGAILLVSGATPAAANRMETLDRLLPLPVMELSHFLASLVGVALLFLARALLQRIDAAYFLTLGLLATGAVASLLKGLDYEEATILSVMFVSLLPCRRFFYRRSSLVSQSFSASWALAILLVLLATGFVTSLAYRHVEYSNQLWWQFEASGHAPRSLRALVGGFALLGFYCLARLLRPAPPTKALPSGDELERVRPLVAASPRTVAHLALLGDKRLLFHEAGHAFLMYGVQGRSWISMGDPVGAPAERRELAWRFRELADQHGGRTVFYEVAGDDLPVYVDLGLSLRKLGEEARVPLEQFSLEGSSRKGLRQSERRAEREGCSFEVLRPEAVPPLLDELEAISDAWLAGKNTREKRFSLGFFDRANLSQLPVAVVRRDGRIVAFANVWMGAEKHEITIDLMRYGSQAPSGTMEYLFVQLMLWGRSLGYRWFSLGVAPLSGLEHHRLAPLWNRFGALLFRYGEHFYNFQGLRSFKAKFDPVWEPRFLASPGGLAVPVVLGHVAALVSGGVSGVVAKRGRTAA
jgi:phosphatidylglycerol lysyltransferase